MKNARRAKTVRTALLTAAGVLLLIVSFQNLDPVPVRLLFWKPGVRPVILLPLTLLTGFAAGLLLRKKTGNK